MQNKARLVHHSGKSLVEPQQPRSPSSPEAPAAPKPQQPRSPSSPEAPAAPKPQQHVEGAWRAIKQLNSLSTGSSIVNALVLSNNAKNSNNTVKNSNRTLLMALGFELALGSIGLIIAWIAGLSLGSQIHLTWPGLFQGLVATVPMLVLLRTIIQSRWPPLVELRLQSEELLSKLFQQSMLWQLALVSIAAGVGEELLFRGILQQLLQQWIDPILALLLVGLLFGLAHALSATYFVLATLAGIYLGWITLACDNLVPPMIAHGLYDFIALWYLLGMRGEE